MTINKTSTRENGLIWFGAAVSLAEIMTGAAIAPLGLKRGITAIIVGHIIGCILLFLSGTIGGYKKMCAMDTVKSSFGNRGYMFFALMNVLQLAGWTSIMIYDGAYATNSICNISPVFWITVIAILIMLWISLGRKKTTKLNSVAVSCLFVLTVVLSFVVFGQGGSAEFFSSDSMSFGAALELSVAMPLSWLPLISDYTKDAKYPLRASAVSSVVYGLVSSWMYIIGLGAAVFAGENDIVAILVKSGMGITGIAIVVLSTVTTTFLDANSAGISAGTLFPKISTGKVAIGVTVAGAVFAAVYPVSDISDFLYLIGSVFAPMISVQIADFFILKKSCDHKAFSVSNFIIWLAGFILYRIMMKLDLPVGSTLPAMASVIILCLLRELFFDESNVKS